MREKELWATVHMLAGAFGACLDQLRQVVVFLRRQELLLPALRAQLNLAHAQIFLLQTVEAQHLVAFVADQARLLRDSDLQCRARQLMLLADRRLRQCVPERGPSDKLPCSAWSPILTARKADISCAISTGHIMCYRQHP